MKLFRAESDPSAGTTVDDTARLSVETALRVIRLVKKAMREHPPTGVTLSGLRTLAYLADSPGGCLSDVAEHLFVGNPTASKVVDDLVERGLLNRSADAADRRRLTLTVTAEGRKVVRTAARPAEQEVAARLRRLSAGDRKRLHAGLVVMYELLEETDREAVS
jgi:DNA-binding MarR family transcriptional regulator